MKRTIISGIILGASLTNYCNSRNEEIYFQQYQQPIERIEEMNEEIAKPFKLDTSYELALEKNPNYIPSK